MMRARPLARPGEAECSVPEVGCRPLGRLPIRSPRGRWHPLPLVSATRGPWCGSWSGCGSWLRSEQDCAPDGGLRVRWAFVTFVGRRHYEALCRSVCHSNTDVERETELATHACSDGLNEARTRWPRTEVLATRALGCILERNSEAMNPEARCRAVRQYLGGSESRNRLSEALAWPAFFFWERRMSRRILSQRIC